MKKTATLAPAHGAPARTLGHDDQGLAGARKLSRCEESVRRCCRFIDEHLSENLTLDDLCRVAAYSPRMLEYAFHSVLGSSPMTWYRARRFAKARRALQNASPSLSSVTEIATRYSFWHLGRFSVEYRERFGESPSSTLGRTRELA